MIRASLYSLILLFAANLFAQKSYESIPEHWNFEKEKSFEKHEATVLEAIELFMNNPIEQGNLNRNRTIKFIHDWGNETPTLLVVPFSRVSKPIFKDFRDKKKKKQYGADLFTSYYGGMLKHLIENENSELKDVHIAGIENVIQLHKNNKELLKDSEAVAKFINLKEAGKLEKWIERRTSRRDIKGHKCYQDESCTKRAKYTKRPVAF